MGIKTLLCLNNDKIHENDKKEFCRAVCLIDENKIINNMVLNLLNRLFGSSLDALPNSSVAVEEKKKDSKREEKYDSDIEALKQKYGVEFKSGLCIELPLKEIINICPRTRRRVDAYFGLVSYLKSEYGITLKITSNKTKI